MVVDQSSGKRWVEKDPCLEYVPGNSQNFVLVRVLGQKLTDGYVLGKRGLPDKEPSETETVRWAFAQLNQSWRVAGPDVASIEEFLKQCRLCDSIGMKGATFVHDLSLVAEHLRGAKRPPSSMSYFERRYLAMLEEILPRHSVLAVGIDKMHAHPTDLHSTRP